MTRRSTGLDYSSWPTRETRDAHRTLGWHRVRKWVEENDPDDAWPKTIVYRSLRHHAATKWFHDELGESWDVVAQYLGDKLTTVLNHYVRAGEDALRDSVSKLADR